MRITGCCEVVGGSTQPFHAKKDMLLENYLENLACVTWGSGTCLTQRSLLESYSRSFKERDSSELTPRERGCAAVAVTCTSSLMDKNAKCFLWVSMGMGEAS